MKSIKPTAESPSESSENSEKGRKQQRKKHSCEDCGESFQRKVILVKHRAKKHAPPNTKSVDKAVDASGIITVIPHWFHIVEPTELEFPRDQKIRSNL